VTPLELVLVRLLGPAGAAAGKKAAAWALGPADDRGIRQLIGESVRTAVQECHGASGVESQQRVEAQLRAILDAYHPAPAQLFSSIDRDITLAFIADYPTPQAAARIGEQRMAAFCRRQSYRGRVDPAILAQRLKDNLLAGADGTVAGKSHSAQVFAELLGLLNRQLTDYDDALERVLAKHADAHIFPQLSRRGVADRGHSAERNR
jgi:hypothetical protein